MHQNDEHVMGADERRPPLPKDQWKSFPTYGEALTYARGFQADYKTGIYFDRQRQVYVVCAPPAGVSGTAAAGVSSSYSLNE